MKSKQVSKHISQRYNEELESLRKQVMVMGGLVEQQLRDAIDALLDMDGEKAEKIIERDKVVNGLEVRIDEESVQVLAKRQPTAGDLRLVMTIIKTVTDLERIGDEAEKIARMAVELSSEHTHVRPKKKHLKGIVSIANHVIHMLQDALDSFARMDVDTAMKVAHEEREVDEKYAALSRELITYMMEDPRSISSILDVTWSARALERVGDHANNIAEYTVYLVKGKDVRHVSIEEMQQVATE